MTRTPWTKLDTIKACAERHHGVRVVVSPLLQLVLLAEHRDLFRPAVTADFTKNQWAAAVRGLDWFLSQNLKDQQFDVIDESGNLFAFWA